MSDFVESLRRLYRNHLITDAQLKTLLTKGKILSSEYAYIVKE